MSIAHHTHTMQRICMHNCWILQVKTLSAGSARARGFPMGSNLGSQNRTPLQRKYHKAHVRTPSAKAAKPQAPAASTQEVPAYAQPRPRMPIPVRSSHPFDPPREGVLLDLGAVHSDHDHMLGSCRLCDCTEMRLQSGSYA